MDLHVSRLTCYASLAVILLFGGEDHAAPPAATRPASAPASRPAKIVQFQPGIRIDWTHREVLADATVVMREGLIEVFACSPHQREHEAVVRLEARPLHLYQALGLIGLRPGHPIRINEETEKIEPATGDPVQIQIRCEREGRTVQEPIESWLRVEKTGKPPSRLPWVFAGSVNTENGFAADFEGTVIALVDFGSSLVALPEQHSSSNEELWLEPATEQIPAVGTRCVLVLRAGPLRIVVDRAARITLNGQQVSRAELARRLAAAVKEDPGTRVDLSIDPACPPSQSGGIEQLLRMVGIREENLTTSRPAAAAEPRHDPAAFQLWLRRQLAASSLSHDGARPGPGESAHRLLDDLRDRELLLRARAEGLSESLSALSHHVDHFLSGSGSSAEQFDRSRSE